MSYMFFQVDAFTAQLFSGNPAAVILFDSYPSDQLMQSIAAENNLAETAFLVRSGTDFQLRWFTPAVEVPLCGHATLASAAVVLNHLEPGRRAVTFHTASGALAVERSGEGFSMDFPSRPANAIPCPPGLEDALQTAVHETYLDAAGIVAILNEADAVRALTPDQAAILALGGDGVIVSAPGDGPHDFISRYFAPGIGIPEDPVTGAIHCMLAPYWSNRLSKQHLFAAQASKRGGELNCRIVGNRVAIAGYCAIYAIGNILI